ncbi:5'-AMP-activated protein kinase catalytic subunit [Thraustotheca clavata]|uniref:Protein cereblon n=1 Tax=Thraustotheca clavata TaxID=74557 RepID=A0A1W0A5Z2_9STRA|nr:5'-AMP-activated protein kinase catalytic subunit [Thraustotheca clavata]
MSIESDRLSMEYDEDSGIETPSDLDEVEETILNGHSYLGEDVGITRHTTAYYEPGTMIDLPLVILPQIVIFPGETLPLRMLSSATIRAITIRTRLRQEYDTFAVINTLAPPTGHIGTIIQIERIYEQNELHLSIVGRGCQRFQLQSIIYSRDDQATIYAHAKVLPDYHALPRPFPNKRQSFGYWRNSEYNLFDGELLVQRAKVILATSAEWHHFAGTISSLPTQPLTTVTDPTQFSFWLCARLNLTLEERQKLLTTSCTIQRLRAVLAWLNEHTSSIYCAGCHTPVGDTTDIFCKNLPTDGVSSGTFVNPGGYVHQILTMYSIQTDHIVFIDRPTARDTWFPGYTWQCMMCSMCNDFLGWRYVNMSGNQVPMMMNQYESNIICCYSYEDVFLAPHQMKETPFSLAMDGDSSADEYQVVGDYALGKTIGRGTFGKVKAGTHVLTGERVAVKILEKCRILEVADAERVAREIKILKRNYHTNLYEVIDTSHIIYLIMEFVDGGEMFEHIVKNHRIREKDAVRMFLQIVEGLDYIHKNDVTHRDLKPENLLLQNHPSGLIVKIVDFGLSNTHENNRLLRTACGSPCYAAPEMIEGKMYVGPKADIWSLGVILFAMVCGFLPFEDNNTSILYKKILSGQYKAPNYISTVVQDLIRKILETDPVKRFTLDEIREHAWCKSVDVQLPKALVPITMSNINKMALIKLGELGLDSDTIVQSVVLQSYNKFSASFFLINLKLNRPVEKTAKRRRYSAYNQGSDRAALEDAQKSVARGNLLVFLCLYVAVKPNKPVLPTIDDKENATVQATAVEATPPPSDDTASKIEGNANKPAVSLRSGRNIVETSAAATPAGVVPQPPSETREVAKPKTRATISLGAVLAPILPGAGSYYDNGRPSEATRVGALSIATRAKNLMPFSFNGGGRKEAKAKRVTRHGSIQKSKQTELAMVQKLMNRMTFGTQAIIEEESEISPTKDTSKYDTSGSYKNPDELIVAVAEKTDVKPEPPPGSKTSPTRPAIIATVATKVDEPLLPEIVPTQPPTTSSSTSS